MDDLANLKSTWEEPDPPSSDAHVAARAALMQQITAAATTAPAPQRRRGFGLRLGWLAGSTALAAGLAVAVVFTMTANTTQPGQSTVPAYSEMTGRQVLLTVASTAENRPDTTGTYWHVKEKLSDSRDGTDTLASWKTRDGKLYTSCDGCGGVVLSSRSPGFQVARSILALEELRRLPTDPDALKAWITDSYSGEPDPLPRMSGEPEPPILQPGDIPAEHMPAMVTRTLTGLLYDVPATPAVRAAAFRALASMPNVTNLGEVKGGHALRIWYGQPPADKYPNGKVPEGAGEVTLVIDTETSKLVSVTNYQGYSTILAARCTDTMPKVGEAPAK